MKLDNEAKTLLDTLRASIGATVYYADTDAFDDSRTGYYSTAENAEGAFWSENTFSDRERERTVVYTRRETVDEDVIEQAVYLAAAGSPSPALGLDGSLPCAPETLLAMLAESK